MEIREVVDGKRKYLPFLLLADEQESMINRYLDRGTMFIITDDSVKGECVVTDEGQGILEIKNLAIDPFCRRMGYGKALVEYVVEKYQGRYSILQVGTGDSPLTIPFYEKCGFVRSHKVEDFFIKNYDHPIYEDGIQLVDIIYLQKRLF